MSGEVPAPPPPPQDENAHVTVGQLEQVEAKRRKKVSRAFIAQIVASFAVLTILGYQVQQNRHFAEKLKKTDEVICVRSSQQLTDLLKLFFPNPQKQPGYYKTHPQAKKLYDRALALADPKKCKTLPSQTH